MGDIGREIDAFVKMQARLEASHFGKWVVIRDEKLAGAYDSFAEAAQQAVAKFGAGPYLIRQVGAAPSPLPVSVLYHAR